MQQKQMGFAEWGMLLVLSLLWGGSFLFNGILVKTLPPFTIVAGRVLIAALALNLIVRATGHAFQHVVHPAIACFCIATSSAMPPLASVISEANSSSVKGVPSAVP